MKKEIKILSPCGILGYGFPTDSFEAGLREQPDAIVVDAGSTDAGPHKLGANVAIVSRQACRQDLERLVLAGAKLHIPVIIGSAGGSGGKKHVEWMLGILDEIFAEHRLPPIKQAVIWADIPKQAVLEGLRSGTVTPLGASVPALTEQRLEETTGIVAQMGAEPVIQALQAGAELIVCGRAYDPAPFAAVGILNGFDPALAYHLGKILECGALCAEPGTTKDCMMGVLREDSFEVYSTNPSRRCSTVSVAAHTFYEKDHPYLLHGPGIRLNLKGCVFEDAGSGRVRVRGSRLDAVPYCIKLEGARRAAYRTFVIAGVRDPILIGRLEEVEQLAQQGVARQFPQIPPESYEIRFYNYGINGVMGALEPLADLPHEVGVLFEVVAHTQEIASTLCSSLRSTFMHYGYEGRKSTAGNLAFPFAPSDVEFGPVYEFSVYHLMEVSDPNEWFPITYSTRGGEHSGKAG